MMAAASLLRELRRRAPLDGSAWQAAYDYYGHDEVGVEYADQVVARAIGWAQSGFSINQGIAPKLIEGVHAAWGEPVMRQFAAVEKARKRAAARRKHKHAKASPDAQTETTTTNPTSTQTSTTSSSTTTTTTTATSP